MKREAEEEDPLQLEIPEAPKTLREIAPSGLSGSSSSDVAAKPMVSVALEPERPKIRVRSNLEQRPMSGLFASNANASSRSILANSSASASSRLLLANSSASSSLPHSNSEVTQLKEEVTALQWLARRKEQEWEQILRILKMKEEKLLKAERSQSIANQEAKNKATKMLQTVLPAAGQKTSSPKIIYPSMTTVPVPVSKEGNNSPKIVIQSLSSTKEPGTAPKIVFQTSSAGNQFVPLSNQKAIVIRRMAGGGVTTSSATPKIVSVQSHSQSVLKTNGSTLEMCQGCFIKPSKFYCASCSSRRFCSRECQIRDWDTHADLCKPPS